MALTRTEYRNLSTGTVRTGATGHGESLTDVEEYILPVDRTRNSALHGWGVARGLTVTATAGAAGVTVATGTALDADGDVVALVEGGLAVTDPTADPTQVQNVPTVPVVAAGVPLATAGTTGEVLVTLTWREVAGTGLQSNSPVRHHAPWLRLVPAVGYADTGQQVVLARASLGPGGEVTALTAGPRRQVDAPAGRLELRIPRATGSGAGLSVGHVPAAELVADSSGGVALTLLAGPSPRTALAVDAASGDVTVGGALTVSSALRVSGGGGKRWDVAAGADGRWRLVDAGAGAGADRVVVDGSGRVGIGIGGGVQRTLHVEGSEVHSGGGGGGFSFADRSTGAFTDAPSAGQRWVWYADGGTARLWSGSDRLTLRATGGAAGLDVGRRMRVRQGGDASAGIWFSQDAAGDRGFVGMVDDGRIGLWGNTGAAWGLRMDTSDARVVTSRALDVGVDHRSPLRVFGDAVVGAGGNGVLKVRHVDGKSWQDDADDGLYFNWNVKHAVHVGGAQRGELLVDAPNSASSLGSWSGGGVGAWDLFARGAVYVGADPSKPKIEMYSSGFLKAVTKAFVIDHPLDPEHRTLTHGSLEGPELGVYYRGEARLEDGLVRVGLPDYFEPLVRPEGRTVVLTPVADIDEPVSALATTPVTGGAFTVRAVDDRNPAQRFYWQVTAVRSDVPPLVVEAPKRAEVGASAAGVPVRREPEPAGVAP